MLFFMGAQNINFLIIEMLTNIIKWKINPL
jgi:hypothetical protein